jgi:hypothetical protein
MMACSRAGVRKATGGPFTGGVIGRSLLQKRTAGRLKPKERSQRKGFGQTHPLEPETTQMRTLLRTKK